MKEITRINLAGLPFNIEVDARHELEKYLQAVRRALGVDDDSMREIEARIVELLAERSIVDERVIDSAAVEAIKSQLGAPSELAGDTATSESVPETTERRLMRDTDHAQISGVCAGLAAYLHVDSAWVRLAAVLLIFFSFGMAILVYLVAWVVIPPARTAADKLVMAGKPVTLEAIKIQTESAVSPKYEPIFVKLLRCFSGIIAAFTGAAVAVGFAYSFIFSSSWLGDFGVVSEVNGWAAARAIIISLGVLLFVVLCELVAYMLIAKKFTQRFFVAAGIIIMAGLTMFASSMAVSWTLSQRLQQISEKATTSYDVDASAVVGATSFSLSSQADDSVAVSYVVTDGKPRVTVSYNTYNFATQPTIKLQRDGDKLSLSAKTKRSLNLCMGGDYCNSVHITIYGPALQEIDAQNHQLNYAATGQAELTVKAEDAAVTISSSRTIDLLTATLSGTSRLSAADAAISAVKLTSNAASDSTFATIKSLDATIPSVCASGYVSMIYYNGAPQITLNGESVTLGNDYSCVSFLNSYNYDYQSSDF